MKVRKAVIPAAGLGTRFLPATKAQPKEMLPIVDKPTLQFIVEEAVQSGIEEILLITGRGKASIENHFDKSVELELVLEQKGNTKMLELVRSISDMADIHFIRQKEQRGLGHAIYCARHFVGNEPFAVLLGDDVVYTDEKPALAQLMETYERVQTSVLGVQEVAEEDVSKYGIIEGKEMDEGLYRIRKLIEKPKENAPSRIAVLGRYVLNPSIMEVIARTKPGVNDEIQLTDAIMQLSKSEPVYAQIYQGRRYDAGSKQGFLEATVEYALRNPELRGDFEAYLHKLYRKLDPQWDAK